MTRADDLARIHEAIMAAADAIRPFTSGDVEFKIKSERGDPLTAADEAADRVLREMLPAKGEGWLSEESIDDPVRLGCRRVWVVDPIDGTREFIDGIPEWCISVGLVEDGVPVAGGIYNPATDELAIGSLETGVEYQGRPSSVTGLPDLDGATILASRSEIRRGAWSGLDEAPCEVRPCGSVAYKMALVAAGRADGTWTLVGKSEWDVAAGTALVRAAGGSVIHADGTEPAFNQPVPRYPNFLAAGAGVLMDFRENWMRVYS
jgi:myo-inositol-1(or 4)-monophosphatase